MAKNTHLEHLEDDIINNGSAGATNSIRFLKSLRDMLTTGKGGTNVKVTTKWDGAPAIVCGTDPELDLFFVGTKSVFAKSNPKICYSDADIETFYGDHPIKDKLKQCLSMLSTLPIQGVLQGDLLFTETPPLTTMGGKRCYKFKPNTITYCVEAATKMGQRVGGADLGIVFHTYYRGSSIESMSAGFGVDVSKLQGNKKIAVFSSTFQNVNGKANLTSTELNKINNTINTAESNLNRGKAFLDKVSNEKGTVSTPALFKIYFNQVVKSGRLPSSSRAMGQDFTNFVTQRYNAEIAKKKTPKAQKDWTDKKDECIKYLNTNATVMYAALSGFMNLIQAKIQIINKLNKIEGVGTFLEDENGYKVTSPEGFVAIQDGAALKLVDRLEFSRANFTVAKDWGK
jgi:hypothetical protein